MNNIKEIKIDAQGEILGRLSTRISSILLGKDKTDFAYNKISGDKVLVYNTKKIIVTGNKAKDKKYYSHSGYLGNLKTQSYEKLFSKNPTRILYLSVKNMLPKNRLQKLWLKNLKILPGDLNDNK